MGSPAGRSGIMIRAASLLPELGGCLVYSTSPAQPFDVKSRGPGRRQQVDKIDHLLAFLQFACYTRELRVFPRDDNHFA